MIEISGNLTSHMLTHKTEKNIECDKCDLKFKSKWFSMNLLDLSMIFHDSTWLTDLQNLPGNAALRMHKKTHEDKSLECQVCSAKFSIKSCLVTHMLVHSDERKYKCSFCPNEYKRPQALKCHLSTHTGYSRLLEETSRNLSKLLFFVSYRRTPIFLSIL